MRANNGAAQLSERLREFQRLWAKSGDTWHDDTRREFADAHIAEVVSCVEDAIRGLGEMEQCIQKAVRTCQ